MTALLFLGQFGIFEQLFFQYRVHRYVTDEVRLGSQQAVVAVAAAAATRACIRSTALFELGFHLGLLLTMRSAVATCKRC